MKNILLIALTVFSLSLEAGELVCSGKVDHVAYHGNGRFMVQLSSMNVPVFFCSPDYEWVVNGTTYKTSEETCKMLYSTLLTARTTKEEISRIHFDGDDVPTTCDGWETWKSANIRYINF